MLDQPKTSPAARMVKTPLTPNPERRIETPIKSEKHTAYEALDRFAHASVAKATSGLSLSVLGEAWMDWATHLAVSPGKQLHLIEQALHNGAALWRASLGMPLLEAPLDRRFAGEGWLNYPFNVWAQTHLRHWQWWQNATTDVHGVSPSHEKLMGFVAGLLADTTAPSNFAITNPDVLSATITENGQNFVRGAHNLAEDIGLKIGETEPSKPQHFEVGRNLATTPGKVVFTNELMQLIQYAPTTKTVRPEPILIIPAWIMKYYILDLSPENSLVRFLVAQGYSVFMISWKNPDADDRDLGMEDYRQLGIMDTLDAVQAITQAPKVHAVGYCLGGTLLSIAAASMARDQDNRLATATFLAAQTDFTEAGPLQLFINDSEITLIEDMMAQAGFLSSDQMAAAFSLLRARDLVWAPAIRDYLLGERGDAFDLMAWNADATRMPARMHSEYLRQLFLNNDLAEGRYQVQDKAISISDMRVPIFAVGTEDDHVAPWRSVYKLHLFADTDIEFVLTSGGHNAGIVSEPGHHDRHYRIAHTPIHTPYQNPKQWLAQTELIQGSWWPAFTAWLDNHSAEAVTPPPVGTRSGRYSAQGDAPGTYVLQK